jgi:hypothetical protein
VVIHTLRSDGKAFAALTTWPLGANPAIFFYQDPFPAPAGLRSIAYVAGLGLVGVTSTNELYYRNNPQLRWVRLADAGSPTIFVVANNTTSGRSFRLFGDAGTTKVLARIPGIAVNTFPPSPLPWSLPLSNLDENAAFQLWGRTVPLAIGDHDAWAIVSGKCPSGSVTPCIKRSLRANDGSMGAWQNYNTGDMGVGSSFFHQPWTIQDAYKFRGIRGELWMIAGSARLKSWNP